MLTFGFTEKTLVCVAKTEQNSILLVSCRLGTPAYRLQVKTKDKVCAHALPRATAAPKPASLLREGTGVATCPKAPDPIPLPRRAPALPRVLRLWTPHHH
jgi:hypothetical protein